MLHNVDCWGQVTELNSGSATEYIKRVFWECVSSILHERFSFFHILKSLHFSSADIIHNSCFSSATEPTPPYLIHKAPYFCNLSDNCRCLCSGYCNAYQHSNGLLWLTGLCVLVITLFTFIANKYSPLGWNMKAWRYFNGKSTWESIRVDYFEDQILYCTEEHFLHLFDCSERGRKRFFSHLSFTFPQENDFLSDFYCKSGFTVQYLKSPIRIGSP